MSDMPTFSPSGFVKAAAAPRPFMARLNGLLGHRLIQGGPMLLGSITERNSQTFPTLIVAPLSIDLNFQKLHQ